ncbi:MAG: hypothetical protein C0417_02665 [Chlorobiaceae bacterium]|nr:hypothetical protein [Chlorobiaceae bacterium]
MLERETENILKGIKQLFPNKGTDVICLKDILAVDIPDPIKYYFKAEVEALLRNEQNKFTKESRFNHHHPGIRSLQQQIDSILILNFKFNNMEHRIDEAVHLMINYLVRPQWTLSNIIFEKDKTISTQNLMEIFRYFAPYNYSKEIVIRYFSEKQIESITEKEFRTLLWKADSEYIKRKSGYELAEIISPIFDFFNHYIKSGNYLLPIKAIIKFFEDKGLNLVIPRLEGEVAQGKSEISKKELGDILEDSRHTLGSFQADNLNLDQSDNIDDTDRSISKIEFDISESDKRKFVKKIFSHNEKAYLSLLNTLTKQTSWKQASKLIDEIFIKHEVYPYSSEATKFIEIISEQFHLKK